VIECYAELLLSLCLNVREMLQRERGLHCRVARLGEGKDSMMYLCKRNAQA
jgi:hypothetical protein